MLYYTLFTKFTVYMYAIICITIFMYIFGSYLDIPPQREDVLAVSTCKADCTNNMAGPIYLTEAYMHMHYTGYRGYIFHLRNNEVIRDLVVEEVFSYDSPIFHV